MVFSVQGTGFDGPTREQRVHVSRKRRQRGCRKREGWMEQASRVGAMAFV